MRQLDVFGLEVELPREEVRAWAPATHAGVPLELFRPDAFAHRVPGTLALEVEPAPALEEGSR